MIGSGERTLFVDGLAPKRVERPETVSEVADVLRECSERGEAVIPVGAGTALGRGNVPERYDVALSTLALSGILAYEPADLTVTVSAGTRMGELQETLRANGQFLPLDVPDEATIGGVLASNESGFLRVAYGTARDITVGMRFVLASGDVVSTGGRVVKNVAGYDLSKLMIGSLGTLGVIVEASFKVYPVPAGERVGVISTSDIDAAFTIARDLRLPVGVQTLLVSSGLQPDSTGCNVIVGIAGAGAEELQREVESRAGAEVSWESGADARRYLGVLRERTRSWVVRATGTARPSDLRAAAASADTHEVVALPSVGIAYLGWDAPPLVERFTTARAEFESRDGALIVASAPRAFKEAVGTWGRERPEWALARRIKRQLDPHGSLSPGRFVGGI